LDQILHSLYANHKSVIPFASFGSWILYNSLSLMNLYLVSGFELELYSKYEYHYVYWYLCEVVLNWQINTLSRIDTYLMDNEAINSTFLDLNYYYFEIKKCFSF
jgi:hypothetical protein